MVSLIHIAKMRALGNFSGVLRVHQVVKEPRKSPMLAAGPFIYYQATQTVNCERE